MSIEPFLVSQVAPSLVPPERILGCALLRRPRRVNAFGIPQEYEDYLGVATDLRLIVFETDVGGMLSPVAKPIARNPVVWSYDELASLSLDEVKGLVIHSGGRGRVLFLDPIPGLGPYAAKDPSNELDLAASRRRYDVYAQIEGVPGQTRFMDEVLPWLAGQFNSGAFAPSPARRQEIDARLAAARAATEAERQRRAANNAAQKPKLLKAAVGGAGAFVALGGLLLGLWGVSDALKRQRMLEGYETAIELQESDLTWSRGSAPMPPGCPEQEAGTSLPIVQYTCHGCERSTYARSGWRRLTRDGETYVCPPPSFREESLARTQAGRAHTQKDLLVAVGAAGAAVVLLLAGALGALLGIRAYGRRLAAASSNARRM